MNGETHATFRPFLLMEGGPLFHLLERVRLVTKNARLTRRRALVAAGLTWVPLLIMAALQGRAIGRSVPLPFLKDFSAYSRLLIEVPLLLLAENIMAPRIAAVAAHFVVAGLVGERDYSTFDKIVDRGLRARDSKVAEAIFVVVAFGLSIASFTRFGDSGNSWYVSREGGRPSLTMAGWWMVGFCIPLLQFLVLRWLWRLFLWFQFLSRLGRLDLNLYPPHPDKAGGLGFVGETQKLFGILLFSYSIGISGVLANQVVYDKVNIRVFAPAIAAYAIIGVLLVMGPLIVFTRKLHHTKRLGLLQYGSLATAYTGMFHRKWIEGEDDAQESLLGTGDIQSLADLGNSFAYVERMSMLPSNPKTALHLAIAALLPMVPLLLTVMPLKDVAKLLLKVLM